MESEMTMRALAFYSVTLSLVLLAGCGGGDFPTAKVTGRVVCDGKPVGNVLVFFEPLKDGNNALVGKQGIGRAGEDGTFEVSTYGTNDGAVVGKHRVRVGWKEGKFDPSCGCEVNSDKDVMEVEIKKGTNEIEVVLPKAKGKHKLTPEEREALEEAKEED